jgi:hypothetical protein
MARKSLAGNDYNTDEASRPGSSPYVKCQPSIPAQYGPTNDMS